MSRWWQRWKSKRSGDLLAGEVAAELVELSGDAGLAIFHLVAAIEDRDLFRHRDMRAFRHWRKADRRQ